MAERRSLGFIEPPLDRLNAACGGRRARAVWRGSWDGRFARVICSVHGGGLMLASGVVTKLMRQGSVFDLRDGVDAAAVLVLSDLEQGGRR